MVVYYNPGLDILGILQDDKVLLKISEDNFFIPLTCDWVEIGNIWPELIQVDLGFNASRNYKKDLFGGYL